MPPLILVTGVTGYIGGRLVPHLLASGQRVRVLTRDASRLQGRAWVDQVEIVQGDVLDPDSLAPAMSDVFAAYYLIHSMSGENFHERDLAAAANFGQAAAEAGVERIIYLGGLGDPETDLSLHLRSRQQTGQALAAAGAPVTEFRSAVVVGSGSVSFEMIRNLTERLPVMICPQWVYTRVQPIGIRDVLDYLTAALSVEESAGRVVEIGGADILTYAEMMQGYAAVRGLRRWLISVPVLTPRLSSYWVHWMTPVPSEIARPLIEGLRNEVIVRDESARLLFPHIQPMDYRTAVARALVKLDAKKVETTWSDALASSRGDKPSIMLSSQEGMIVERRQQEVQASPAQIFAAFTALGGKRGWLYWNWAWRVRGVIDRLVGGVGLRRGRRHATDLRVGDAVDFWRVEAVEAERMLLLRAEMKLPGLAWLQFETAPLADGRSLLRQRAFFAPKGLSGLAYWYLLYPVHRFIFSGMAQSLARLAEQGSGEPQGASGGS
ncbi:MAG: SDR family oxidoreductase [Caldilineales bacterium]|nr:SDR family oxidoreductase [Caldilineales bacterium]MCW5857076.1 SDR family oxidoreductase [Caldilineales bacterium]